MMYILQDATKPGRLPFSCVVPIKTVYSLLHEKDALDLLTDKTAVQLVSVGGVFENYDNNIN